MLSKNTTDVILFLKLYYQNILAKIVSIADREKLLEFQ